MKDHLAVFDFQDQPVRTIVFDNEPWFVAMDVCAALDLQNPTKAIQVLKDYQHRVHTMDVMLANGAFQRREMNMINESGLYTLIFKSRKAAAERFQQWVTCDVLPSIRKTGSYGTVKARSSDYSILFRMFNMYHQCTYTALRNAYQVVITQFCRERGFDVPDFTALAKDAQGELL